MGDCWVFEIIVFGVIFIILCLWMFAALTAPPKKKALLISCSYLHLKDDKKMHLEGAIGDGVEMKRWLEKQNFEVIWMRDFEITERKANGHPVGQPGALSVKTVDTSEWYFPSKKNILTQLRTLVSLAQKGKVEVVWLQVSGHGTQFKRYKYVKDGKDQVVKREEMVQKRGGCLGSWAALGGWFGGLFNKPKPADPTKPTPQPSQTAAKPDKKVEDGKDQAFLTACVKHPRFPKLINKLEDACILDKEFKSEFVDPIAQTPAKVVAMFDCCHSGTILDLKYGYEPSNSEWKVFPTGKSSKHESGRIICLSGCGDSETSTEWAMNKLENGKEVFVRWGGAFTNAFLKVFKSKPNLSLDALLKGILKTTYFRRAGKTPRLHSNKENHEKEQFREFFASRSRNALHCLFRVGN